METAAEEDATVTLTTLVAVTVDLAEGETGAAEALADSAVIVTETADLAEETVTGALEEGLTPRPSETELLLTKRALKTNSRGYGGEAPVERVA